MSQDLDVEECLTDKSSNVFESIPEFAEVVAMVHRFGEMFGLTLFSYSDFEQSLNQSKKEESMQPSTSGLCENGEEKDVQNSLLENLITEILTFLNAKFDSSNIQDKLYATIGKVNRWCVPQFNARLLFVQEREIDDAIDGQLKQNGTQPEAPNFFNLSTVDKLKLLSFLIDAQLACAHDSLLDLGFSEDNLRNSPLAIDSVGRKFWYFCDTWLFIEEENVFNVEDESAKAEALKSRIEKEAKHEMYRAPLEIKSVRKKQQKKKKIKRSRKTVKPVSLKEDAEELMNFNQSILDDANKNLFIGNRFRVVCKNSEHFSALIEAYKRASDSEQNDELIEKLEECLKTVRSIEKERIERIERERLEKLEREAKLAREAQEERDAQMRRSARIVILAERQRQRMEALRVKEQEEEARRVRIAQQKAWRVQQHQKWLQEQQEFYETGVLSPYCSSSSKENMADVSPVDVLEEHNYSCRVHPAGDWRTTPATSSTYYDVNYYSAPLQTYRAGSSLQMIEQPIQMQSPYYGQCANYEVVSTTQCDEPQSNIRRREPQYYQDQHVEVEQRSQNYLSSSRRRVQENNVAESPSILSIEREFVDTYRVRRDNLQIEENKNEVVMQTRRRTEPRPFF